MGLLDLIADAVRQRQVNKENDRRRGVTYYRPSQIGGFIGEDACKRNLIISGGSPDLRAEVIVGLCVTATNAGIPVILLHHGDEEVQKLLRQVYSNHPAYQEVGPFSGRFDPLYGLPADDIGRVIVAGAPKSYGLTSDAQAYLEVMTGYLEGRGKLITTKRLDDCPHGNMAQRLLAAGNQQTLTPDKVRHFQTMLAQGQKEAWKIKHFLDDLYDECCQLLPQGRATYGNCVSLMGAVAAGQVLSLDVISDGSNALLGIVAEEMRMLIRRGVEFYLIVDDLTLREENSLKSLGTLKAGTYHYAMAAEDMYALCEGNENLFSSLLGAAGTWFVFRHGSGLSAEKWSQSFTSYLKIDATQNFGRGSGGGSGIGVGKAGMGVNLSGNRNHHQGVSYTNKDEAVVRAEEIRQLSPRSGFVYTADPYEVAYVKTFLPPV